MWTFHLGVSQTSEEWPWSSTSSPSTPDRQPDHSDTDDFCVSMSMVISAPQSLPLTKLIPFQMSLTCIPPPRHLTQRATCTPTHNHRHPNHIINDSLPWVAVPAKHLHAISTDCGDCVLSGEVGASHNPKEKWGYERAPVEPAAPNESPGRIRTVYFQKEPQKQEKKEGGGGSLQIPG
ncbi:unnamed protein product [Boreogadus saida]